MPQLDSVTFLSQFFWLCLFFFGFYYLISKDFLPKMARIFKYRKTRMSFSSESKNNLQEEVERVGATCKTLVENGLNKSSTLLDNNFQRTHSWLRNVIASTNKEQLPNEMYIEWVGDNSIRQQISSGGVAPLSTERIFTNTFFASLFAKKKVALSPSESTRAGETLDQPLMKKRVSTFKKPDKEFYPANQVKKSTPKKGQPIDGAAPKKVTKKKLK